jgi:MIP family channel proteins
MLQALRAHWPEYLMEAAELALFMIAACAVVVVLEHPDSSVHTLLPDPNLRRVLTGLAMGLTAIAIIYSPWGKQSGAHFNPSVTLTFACLGKVSPTDAFFYVVAQFLGAIAGVAVSALALGERLAHPSVLYVATRPGAAGAATAFAAESLISFLIMSLILSLTARPALSPYTGVLAGGAVALFIAVEAPLSGMSMNPARSFAPALVGNLWRWLWIYFAAPPLGMLGAAALPRLLGGRAGHCAKLHHDNDRRCIFCGSPGRAAAARTRRRRVAIALLVATLVVARLPHRAGAQEARAIAAVAEVSMTVADADRSIAFYSEVLDFAKVGDVEVWGSDYEHLQGLFGVRMRVVDMRLGSEHIQLVEYLTPPGRPIPIDSRSNDRWFQHVAIIVSDMQRAFARLRNHRVRFASPAPQTLPDWNPNAGGISAFYFKDPDGHPLEVLHFPPGKGQPRWQATDHLFLGIDHTAIVVADTDASLHFYRDILGMRVAGNSDNYGVEQEHLNNVFAARLLITALRAASGPGIELLEYLSPTDGRPMPNDQRASDIAHWETTLRSDDVAAAAAALRAAHASFVSPGVVELGAPTLGFDRAFLARDPDGHVIRIRD